MLQKNGRTSLIDVEKELKNTRHHLFLIWLIFTGLLVFGLYTAWQQGILNLLYDGDKSMISSAITLIYVLVSIHCAIRIWYISTQSNLTQDIADRVTENKTSLGLSVDGDKVKLNQNIKLPESVASRYIHDLITQADNRTSGADQENQGESELLEVYESKLKGPDEIGWFATDAMIKLGLLGTIIGFILMLSSVVNVTEFDVTTMQKILANMSSGMGTALYTTMAGLVCSLLGAAQYHMLDRHIDELLNNLKHTSQVYIIPHLSQRTR